MERKDNETLEESSQVTHERDYSQDTRVGAVGDGRVLRVRVKPDEAGATLEGANVQIVYW